MVKNKKEKESNIPQIKIPNPSLLQLEREVLMKECFNPVKCKHLEISVYGYICNIKECIKKDLT